MLDGHLMPTGVRTAHRLHSHLPHTRHGAMPPLRRWLAHLWAVVGT